MFIGKYLIGKLSPKDQIKLIRAKKLEKLSIFMEKHLLDETALAEIIKQQLWEVFCKELLKPEFKHDNGNFSFSPENFQSFYDYCKENATEALNVFVEKNLFTKELQNYASQLKCWDLLIMQLKNWNWDSLTIQLKDRDWDFSLSPKNFQGFYDYCKENAPEALKVFEKNPSKKDLQNYASQLECQDFLTMLLKDRDWDFSLSTENLKSFYDYCKENAPKALKVFVQKNLFTKELQNYASQLGYWDLLTMQLKHRNWDFSLSPENFQSFYDYCEENDKEALKAFVEKNLFTEDLKKIALQKRDNLILYQAMALKKLSVKISKEKLCEFDDKVVSCYLEQNPLTEEDVLSAMNNKNFNILKYAAKYSKINIIIKDPEFFWQYFRATKYVSENIQYSPQIEACIFLPQNRDLLDDYIQYKFRNSQIEKQFLTWTDLYPDSIWNYAQNHQLELPLNQRLEIFQNTKGKSEALTQSEYLIHIKLPEMMRNGEKFSTTSGFTEEDLISFSNYLTRIFDLNKLGFEEKLKLLAYSTDEIELVKIIDIIYDSIIYARRYSKKDEYYIHHKLINVFGDIYSIHYHACWLGKRELRKLNENFRLNLLSEQ